MLNDFGLVINIPAKSRFRRPASYNSQGYLTRTMAVLHSVPLITDIKCAKLFVEALRDFGAMPPVRPQVDCRTSNRTVTLPGLIDVHVHVREPGATHKEDWSTCTAAALAGGVTMICAMPNTDPALVDRRSLDKVQALASGKARCDYGLFIGATMDNAEATAALATLGVGLSMELDKATSKMLQIDDLTVWMQHFEAWPKDHPILVRAENKTLAAVLMMSMLYDRSIHVCSISRREEIMVIREAKRRGAKVTCGVSPHHLLLDEADLAGIGRGFALVWPPLGTAQDRQALWENMDIIDVISSQHAPHTAEEKAGPNAPPGFPGLETMLPLLLTAVHDGKMSLEDLVLRLHTNPKRIFGLPDQADTFTEVDLDADWEIPKATAESRCGWTPFAGRRVHGAVSRVVLRGELAYLDGRLFADPGAGREVSSGVVEGPPARPERGSGTARTRTTGVLRVRSPSPDAQRWFSVRADS